MDFFWYLCLTLGEMCTFQGNAREINQRAWLITHNPPPHWDPGSLGVWEGYMITYPTEAATRHRPRPISQYPAARLLSWRQHLYTTGQDCMFHREVSEPGGMDKMYRSVGYDGLFTHNHPYKTLIKSKSNGRSLKIRNGSLCVSQAVGITQKAATGFFSSCSLLCILRWMQLLICTHYEPGLRTDRGRAGNVSEWIQPP